MPSYIIKVKLRREVKAGYARGGTRAPIARSALVQRVNYIKRTLTPFRGMELTLSSSAAFIDTGVSSAVLRLDLLVKTLIIICLLCIY